MNPMKRTALQSSDETPLRIGISSCLVGENVRYDGGHKLDAVLAGTLGPFVDFIPVCPEVGCGLPVPREAMRLVGDPENPRLVTIDTTIDLTPQMEKFCRAATSKLKQADLSGFIFKKNSPSSGLNRVKIYNTKGGLAGTGRGLFARTIIDTFPLLPVDEAESLHDPGTRENFIERMFAYRRWQDFLRQDFSLGRLVEFHTEHKLLMLAHSTEIYRALGRLVAAGGEIDQEELIKIYGKLYMDGMARIATSRKNYNALQHMAGYFRKLADEEEQREILETLEDYQKRRTPLIVPITLLRHYARKYGVTYLQRQVYLSPTPLEAMLRNHS